MAPLDLTADELTEFLAVVATEAVAVAQPDGTPDTEIRDKLRRIADGIRAYGAAGHPVLARSARLPSSWPRSSTRRDQVHYHRLGPAIRIKAMTLDALVAGRSDVDTQLSCSVRPS